MTTATIEAKVRQIRAHLEAAVGDLAADMLSPVGGCVDDEWSARITEAKRRKVKDLSGWLADEIYNDPDAIQDLIGDQVYDACEHPKDRLQLLRALQTSGHAAVKKACQSIIDSM